MSRFSRVYLYSTSPDRSFAFTGSSPFGGDTSGTGIVLPPDPTVSQTNRYLCRLCGLSLPPFARGVVRYMRQMLTIGCGVCTDPPDGPEYPFELQVTDPLWHFVDGNVSWHLRRITQNRPDVEFFGDTAMAPPYSFTRDSTDSAIVSRRIPVSAGGPGYTALNNGIPYGDDLAGLGNFHDIRWPWNQGFEETLGVEAIGPCDITLFASVYQTDPERRPEPPIVVGAGPWVRPEDAFVARFPNARYWRVGAEMVVDVYHDDKKPTCHPHWTPPDGGKSE